MRARTQAFGECRLTRGQLLRGVGGLVLAAAAAGAPALAADSSAQERQIGEQVYADMLGKDLIVSQSPFYPVLRSVGRRISQAAQPHSFTMNFIVIKGNTANAFSAPGGNVYVNQGLLRTADNQDELAAVLGHETAHLVLGHVVGRQQTQQHIDAFSQFVQKFVHNTGSQNTYTASTIVGKYGFLNFTRSQEYAADQEGVNLAASAGFNPWGAVWFFNEVEKLYGDAGFEQYVQQHPSTTDRTARIDSYLKGDPKKFGHWSSKLTDTDGLPTSNHDDRLILQ